MTDAPKTAARIPQRRHNEDRLRRADSWLRRSEAAGDDTEEFVFLWVAFNAAYGRETIPSDSDLQPTEREKFEEFLRAVLALDYDNTLEEILWSTYSGPIRVLLENRYVFKPFWDAVRDPESGGDWESRFSVSNAAVLGALGAKNAHHVLRVVFMRLYTLRNQIVHGGATFGTGWGQRQVKDGCKIMASLVPAILKIMRTDIEKNPDSGVWGRVLYPRVGGAPG